MHSTLSRTSSVASISSDDAARRTRKRFTSIQLMILEQLFHQTSHPTREEREAVALAAGMEMKSVTIWFQNKRQTERKVALHHATNPPLADPHPPASTSTSHLTRPLHAHAFSSSFPTTTHAPHRKITPPRSRPSLDRVAARSESRLPPPRTPTKPRNPHATPWDNMPSSPLAPPASPPARDLVEFMGSRSGRTLEWACEAARLAGKQGRRTPRAHERLPRWHQEQGWERDGDPDLDVGIARSALLGDDTEEDDIEAVTPEGTLGASDAAWYSGIHATVRTRPALPPLTGFAPPSAEAFSGSMVPGSALGTETSVGKGNAKEDVPQDEDMMHAALALCGLGRTRSG